MGTYVKITISLPPDLAEYVDTLAEEARAPRSKVIADLIEKRRSETFRELLAEGYTYYAEEMSRFAEEAMPLAAEIWPPYDETPKRRRSKK